MTLTPSQIRSLTWIGLAAIGLALVWVLGPVLTPFLVAAVLAYALQPAVEALVRRRWPRWLAVPLIETVTLLAILAVLLLVVPVMARELPLMRDRLPELAERLNAFLAPWLGRMGIQSSIDGAGIKAFVLKHLSANIDDWAATALSSLKIGGSFVLALVGNAVLVPVVLFYLLMDWDAILGRFRALVPPRFRESVNDFVGECDHVLGQYFRGQLLVMGILAVYYAAALGLAGFDLALPVGVFTGLGVAVPYLGFGLGLVLAVVAAALQFGSVFGFAVVAVIYGIGQVLESVFLTPRLVGERIGLHPVMVIFALLAFGQLFGFVGVLLALPISAVGVVAVRRLRDAYLGSPLFRG